MMKAQWVAVFGLVVGLAGCGRGERLQEAIASGDVDRVREVVAQRPAEVNEADQYGWTPLMSAVVRHDVAAVDVLLKAGADVRARDRKMGMTALEMARQRLEQCTAEHLEQELAQIRRSGRRPSDVVIMEHVTRDGHSPQAATDWQKIVGMLEAAERANAR